MCRWFAYVSIDEEALLEDLLITPTHSLIKQVNTNYLPDLFSHDPEELPNGDSNLKKKADEAGNRLLNADGFGVAWYTSAAKQFNAQTFTVDHPALYKHSEPPINNQNFHSICANVASRVVFAHIRFTSGSPVTTVNNHPFVFGQHTFMHNGYIDNFLYIVRDMADLIDHDAYANIKGSTDSEHLAALYITYLTDSGGRSTWERRFSVQRMKKALLKTITTVIELQQKALGDRNTPNAFNLATTDGQQLLAFRVRNHATEQPPSLYYSTHAGCTMNRKFPDHPDGKENREVSKDEDEHGHHVIVASEPSTYIKEDWHLIPKNNCLMAEAGKDPVVESLDIGEEWYAKTKQDHIYVLERT